MTHKTNENNVIKNGFVPLIGRPNVGKSTLINALLQKKIAIVSKNPQTTRQNILGILNKNKTQIFLIDTPGIHQPQDVFGQLLNRQSYNAVRESNIIAWLTPCNEVFGTYDQKILNFLQKNKEQNIPVILLLSKCDTVSKNQILKKIIAWEKRYLFVAIIPISAVKKINLATIINVIEQNLKINSKVSTRAISLYQPKKNFIITELIREKILRYTYDEIPYNVTINLVAKEKMQKKTLIHANVIVNNTNQKKIIIGHAGKLLNKIIRDCCIDLKRELKCSISLFLKIQVIKNWRQKTKLLF